MVTACKLCVRNHVRIIGNINASPDNNQNIIKILPLPYNTFLGLVLMSFQKQTNCDSLVLIIIWLINLGTPFQLCAFVWVDWPA